MPIPLRSLALRSFRPSTTQLTSPLRGYQSSATRLAGKESALHNEQRAEEAEHHKQEQLREQKEGKGKWKDELASDSESMVKADRGEVEASEHTIDKLQKETEQLATKMHQK